VEATDTIAKDLEEIARWNNDKTLYWHFNKLRGSSQKVIFFLLESSLGCMERSTSLGPHLLICLQANQASCILPIRVVPWVTYPPSSVLLYCVQNTCLSFRFHIPKIPLFDFLFFYHFSLFLAVYWNVMYRECGLRTYQNFWTITCILLHVQIIYKQEGSFVKEMDYDLSRIL